MIVGGGLASQRCAETLRRRGHDGRIRMVCGEAERPYDRPPLSKDHLAGELSDDDVSFRSAGWYEDNGVELIVGRCARSLDPGRRRLELDDGTEVIFEDLVIATGAAARRLPPLEGYDERSLPAHAGGRPPAARGASRRRPPGGRRRRLHRPGSRLHSAARRAPRSRSSRRMPAPLTGILGEEVGLWLMKMHDEEGVDVRLGTKLEGARGNGAVEELVLATGEPIACDAVVVGIGVAPAAGWLKGSGLETDGVLTDQAGRTSMPDVWAAGDVARSFDHRSGEHRRRSTGTPPPAREWPPPGRSLGDEPDPPPLPSFWSDQYGLRIQYFGHAEGADAAPVEGRPSDRDFAVVYTREGQPVGALVVGRPRAFARLRKEIERTYDQDESKGATMSYIPKVDRRACSAHGDCVDIAPEVFELGDTAEVIGSGPDKKILKAAKACPALAIEVVDPETGEVVYP